VCTADDEAASAAPVLDKTVNAEKARAKKSFMVSKGPRPLLRRTIPAAREYALTSAASQSRCVLPRCLVLKSSVPLPICGATFGR
jgi:hypothetical protein